MTGRAVTLLVPLHWSAVSMAFAPPLPLKNTLTTRAKEVTNCRNKGVVLSDALSDAQRDALEATRKYGAQSPQARVAWEIAEEVEDSIYSPCSKRCDVYPPRPPDGEGGATTSTGDNALFVDESGGATRNPASGTASASPGDTSLSEAIRNAKRLSEEMGSDSSEALAAWDVVEDIGSRSIGRCFGMGEE